MASQNVCSKIELNILLVDIYFVLLNRSLNHTTRKEPIPDYKSGSDLVQMQALILALPSPPHHRTAAYGMFIGAVLIVTDLLRHGGRPRQGCDDRKGGVDSIKGGVW